MFFNIEIKDLKLRLYELEKVVSNQAIEMEKLKTHINSLRGLINRKQELILDLKESKQEKETIKNDDGLDGFRI